MRWTTSRWSCFHLIESIPVTNMNTGIRTSARMEDNAQPLVGELLGRQHTARTVRIAMSDLETVDS